MFGNWLNGVEKTSKNNVKIGICALMWAIWNCRNDVVFNKSTNAHFLQVILMVTHRVVLPSGPVTTSTYGFGFQSARDGCSHLLEEYKMHRCLFLLFFHWFIFMYPM
jgi:hypothetical protein